MLPGLIARLHQEIQDKLRLSEPPSPPHSPPTSPTRSSKSTRKAELRRSLSALRASPRFSSLVPLATHIAILNDPTRRETNDSRRHPLAGRAPAFNPSLLPWIGGSLAGALKTGGQEIKRDVWEAAVDKVANARPPPVARDVFGGSESEAVEQEVVLGPAALLQDWSRPAVSGV
jgi:actin-related protein 10